MGESHTYTCKLHALTYTCALAPIFSAACAQRIFRTDLGVGVCFVVDGVVCMRKQYSRQSGKPQRSGPTPKFQPPGRLKFSTGNFRLENRNGTYVKKFEKKAKTCMFLPG